MDKAGAYGIQGLGGAFVSGYFGDFDTVVGLSVELTGRLISEALKND
jgi:septum formation protein